MNVRRSALLAALLLGLSACPSSGDDGSNKPAAKPSAAPSTALAPAASSPAQIKPEAPKMAIEPRVKAELDGRADGASGAAVNVAGAKASLQAPTGWDVGKADPVVVSSADKRASIAATSFGAEGPTAKLAAATAALGLSACEWGAPETIALGKGKLAATGADGVCTKGATQVRTAFVAPTAEGLLVAGAWEAGSDVAGMFGAMRSIAKAAGGGDASGIAACCAALRGNANVAPIDQKAALLAAAGVCDSIRNDPNGRAALAQVRAALRGANVPASCK